MMMLRRGGLGFVMGGIGFMVLMLIAVAVADDNNTENITEDDGEIRYSDLLTDINNLQETINEITKRVKKFQEHSEEIESELEKMRRYEHIRQMNRTALEDLAYGVSIHNTELIKRIEDLEVKCENEKQRVRNDGEKTIESLRKDVEVRNWCIAILIIIILVCVIYFRRHKIFGKG